jgi:hypothetical protein
MPSSPEHFERFEMFKKICLLNGYIWFINSQKLLKYQAWLCSLVLLSALFKVFQRNRYFKFLITI